MSATRALRGVVGLVVFVGLALLIVFVFASPVMLVSAQPAERPPMGAEPQICPTCPPVVCPVSPLIPTSAPVVATPNLQYLTPTPVPVVTVLPNPNTPVVDVKPYQVQPGTPLFMQNISHADLKCGWMGVAGQVFDRNGKELTGMVVIVKGNVNGVAIEEISMTGLVRFYGPAGYEIQIGNGVFNSSNQLTISLYDMQGRSLSNPLAFSTVADCTKNLILINFRAAQ